MLVIQVAILSNERTMITMMAPIPATPPVIKCSKFKAKMTTRYCVTVCKFACAGQIPCKDLANAFATTPAEMNDVVKNHSTSLSDAFVAGFQPAKPATIVCAPELVPDDENTETMSTEPMSIETTSPTASTETPTLAPIIKKRRGGFEKGRKLGPRNAPKALPDNSPVLNSNTISPPRPVSVPPGLGAPYAGDPQSSLITFVETAPGSDLYKIEEIDSMYHVMHLLENSKRHVVIAMNARKF
jgi:hypothetical protein